AIGCGLCSAAGTIIPPILRETFPSLFIVKGTLFTELLQTPAGMVSLGGVLVSLIGIVLVGGAGMSKENELPEEQKKAAVAEFNFNKGLLVAIFSGLMSAAMSLGLQGGPDIEKIALATAPITSNSWKGMPVLAVVLLGGFVVNSLWCLFLNLKNKTIGDYAKSSTPIIPNLFFAALAGAIWCSQFICFKTGEPAMGKISYVGWAVLMASSILFSSLLGIFLGEWKNTSNRTKTLLALGLAFLVLSSVVSAYSGYLQK
ncbi:MAG: L-rhamnose/proton symporter RhaT, partial [Thermoguttaceae bacterium]